MPTLFRLVTSALLPCLLAASGCHTIGSHAESPTAEQPPPARKFWEPGNTANQVDQSKIKSSNNAPALHILFVGNSLTFGIPAEVAHLAEAGGDAAIVKSIELSNAKLYEHLATGRVKAELDAAKYDWVILQEQSDLIISDSFKMVDATKALDQQIKSAGARTMLYVIWPPAHGSVAAQRAEQDKITAIYVSLAKEIGAKLAPVGEAFQALRAQHPDYALYKADLKHPSFSGTYLAGAVFYASLYGKTPVGLPGPVGGGMSPSEVTMMESAAWQTVQSKTW